MNNEVRIDATLVGNLTSQGEAKAALRPYLAERADIHILELRWDSDWGISQTKVEAVVILDPEYREDWSQSSANQGPDLADLPGPRLGLKGDK